jgi:hypothetical protein
MHKKGLLSNIHRRNYLNNEELVCIIIQLKLTMKAGSNHDYVSESNHAGCGKFAFIGE